MGSRIEIEGRIDDCMSSTDKEYVGGLQTLVLTQKILLAHQFTETTRAASTFGTPVTCVLIDASCQVSPLHV